MPDIKKDSTGSTQPQSNEQSDETPISKRLEKDADEMAGEALEVEEKYDQDHNIFTK